MFWDETIHALAGNPKPQGDYDWMLERAQEMFDELGGELGELFQMMTTKGLMDLESREGKAGGGFCTTFSTMGVPFIFANFNGTKGDVAVFTHEMGHAFQSWSGRDKPVIDYRGPTPESCEIHSMGLEFLTWPSMGRFFGEEGAEQFRRIHLIDGLKFQIATLDTGVELTTNYYRMMICSTAFYGLLAYVMNLTASPTKGRVS